VKNALERLGELVATGELTSWLSVDQKSGELVHPEARTLFATLPAVTPATSADEIVDLGLWPSMPGNLRRALDAPRYRPGRDLFVRAPVSHEATDRHRPVGTHDPSRPPAFTHLAELRGKAGDNFVVSVAGAGAPLRFARTDVFAWNEPTLVPLSGALSGVQIDYNDPLLKAHVCAAYLDLAASAAELDFGKSDDLAKEAQVDLVRRLARRVSMSYAGRSEGYAGPRAGALLSSGQGVCFVQRAAAAVLLAPFAKTLAFDLAVGIGRTLRLGVPHGFLVLTLRPSLARYVVDPAWGEPLTDLRVAFFGPAWGHDRRLEGFEGAAPVRVAPEAVDLPEVPS
jgi:hypothetical protein